MEGQTKRMKPDETSAMDKVLAYLRHICAQREYCRKDIYDKALNKLGNTVLATKAVDTLENEGFIDEARYARAYTRDKSALKGWGPVKISYMLRSKGVPEHLVKEALGELGTSLNTQKLESALKKKASELKNDPQLKIKLLKFAASRGYAYEYARELIQRLLANSNENETQT